jgi:hypothetical protein
MKEQKNKKFWKEKEKTEFLKHVTVLGENKNLFGVTFSVHSSVRSNVICRRSTWEIFSLRLREREVGLLLRSVRTPTLKGQFLFSSKRDPICLAAIWGAHRQERDRMSLL